MVDLAFHVLIHELCISSERDFGCGRLERLRFGRDALMTTLCGMGAVHSTFPAAPFELLALAVICVFAGVWRPGLGDDGVERSLLLHSCE